MKSLFGYKKNKAPFVFFLFYLNVNSLIHDSNSGRLKGHSATK